ncbi:hypothetical protein IMSHALPRED_005147 [Imshaugia aleurites]|uniref:Uncharacterized protein n=1 Tax=Imshaugia aleurites TaxID=172621 RepID=A0A8H3IJP9_9LECA|nr:hypothetical protein IMSHALPRED_005147 [Imshaugia aleurites]
MAPALLERGLRARRLAAVADSAGDDRGGGDDPRRLGLQDAEETQVGGPAGEEEGEAEFVSADEDVGV